VTAADIRCPANPKRLFLRIERPQIVDGNLIEVACRDCRNVRRERGEDVRSVVHRYNVLGELIETEVFGR
jgi:hypothetical protein